MKKSLIIGVIVVLALVGLSGFFVKTTGNAVSDLKAECNVVDLNEDGVVNPADQVKFNRLYDAHVDKTDYCGYVDINQDRVVNVVDSNRFFEYFSMYYGNYTGPCKLKKLDCQEEKVFVKADSMPESGLLESESPESQKKSGELPSLSQKTKVFLKFLFGFN